MEEQDKLNKFIYKGEEILVSKTGIVYQYGKLRKERYNKDGYSIVTIKTNKGWRSERVARIVATCYIPNPDNLPEVNHKDYNRKNSNVDNLEWVTHADNVRYSVCNKPDTTGKNNPNYDNHKLSEKYKNNPELSIEKQSRKGLKNGRCRKIDMYKNDELIKSFEYIKDCLIYIVENNIADSHSNNVESVRSAVNSSIRENRPYKGIYRFIKY